MRAIEILTAIFLSVVSLSFVFFIYRDEFLGTSNIVYSDYSAFLTGGEIVRKGLGSDLYNLDLQVQFQNQLTGQRTLGVFYPFLTPPITALIFVPLSLLGYETGYLIYVVFNLVLGVGVLVFLSRIFPEVKKYKYWFLLPVAYFPFAYIVVVGQISLILLFIILSIYDATKKRRNVGAGFLTSFLLLKPHLLVVVPFFLLISENKKDFLKGFLVALLALLLICDLIGSSGWLIDYISFLEFTNLPRFGNDFRNMGGFYSLLKYFFTNLSNLHLYILNTVFYVSMVFCFWKKSVKHGVEELDILFFDALVLMIVFSIHSLEQSFVYLLFGLFLFFNKLMNSNIRNFRNVCFILLLYFVPMLTFFGVGYTASLFLLPLVLYTMRGLS